MRAIELARRHQVIDAWRHGIPPAIVAREAHVSVRTVRRWVARWQETGSIEPRRPSGRPRRIPASAAAEVDAMGRANPTATLATFCRLWQQQTGQVVSGATMWRTLNRFGWVKRPMS